MSRPGRSWKGDFILSSRQHGLFFRWEFRIESEKVEGKVVEEAVKEEKKIRAEIRDVIR